MLQGLLGNITFQVAIIFIFGFVISMSLALSVHEYLHAKVAYKNGDPTAKIMGRMTLNPLAHIDPIGLVFLLIFGFGWAKPVPINELNFKNGKTSYFQVAIAGVCGNLILGVIFSFLYALCSAFLPTFNDSHTVVVSFLNIFLYNSMTINFVYAFFNLIPLYPMDGFRVVESCTSPNNSYVTFMKKYSTIILVLLIILDVVGIYLNCTAFFIENKLLEFWLWLFRLFGANI